MLHQKSKIVNNGSSLVFSALGGWDKEKNCKPAEKTVPAKAKPASAVPPKRNQQNRKIFFSFLKKIGGAQNLKKCRENFSVLNAIRHSELRAEAGGLKVRIGIFRKKSSNFVQKAPQFFKIKVFEVGGLGASRRKVEIFQDFPSIFEIKIQSLLDDLEVRLSKAQSKTKFCKPIFFLSAVGGKVKR